MTYLSENRKMGDVLSEHYKLLPLLSRFGIPLGFGDKSIRTVCAEAGVDCRTFLAVANYVTTGDNSTYHDVSIPAMVKFLRLAHQYYIDFMQPELREKLESVVSTAEDKTLGALVLKLFDKYTSEVRRHLEYEDKNVFAYAERLATGDKGSDQLRLATISKQHDNIDINLTELKNVMIKYFPAGQQLHAVNQVLYDIFAYEEDLHSHCDIEDELFLPALIDLESSRPS